MEKLKSFEKEKPIEAAEALELAVRYVLSEENLSIIIKSTEISVGDIERIAKEGVLVFNNLTSGLCTTGAVETLKNLKQSEEISEEYLDIKEDIFGKNQKSCALPLFQTLLTK